jgi:glutamate racemase
MESVMKIGVFDSGLGGLFITRALIEALPQYSYVYLGDTKRVPYGNRSQETIYQYTREAVDFLFAEDCQLIIIACNTASAEALPRIQQEYLPTFPPDRRVLGVIVPTIEEVDELQSKRVGVLATRATVGSQAYPREFTKRGVETQVFQQAAPLLVPLVENNALDFAQPLLEHYLAPLLEARIDTLLLGCTHYSALLPLLTNVLPPNIRVVAQDAIVPASLSRYLDNHPEIEEKLDTQGQNRWLVTDITPAYAILAEQLLNRPVSLELVSYA